MSISVVMPVYNETYIELRQSIKSILNQTFTNFEFIIIDDNPKSFEIRHFLLQIANKDNRIKILFNNKNIGPTRSVNKGIIYAQGLYIARMDADDICNNTRLEKQLMFLRKYKLDLCCSNFQGFKFNLNRLSSPYYGNHNVINQHQIKKIFSNGNIAMGPTLFFKRKDFFIVGKYRNILSEDYDLVARFLINNYLVGYISNILLYKRNRYSNLSNNNSLNEFISTYLISKELKKRNYTRQLPIIQIDMALSRIGAYDINVFRRFEKNFNEYKENRSIFRLLKACFTTFLSPLVLKRNLWMILVNFRNRYKL